MPNTGSVSANRALAETRSESSGRLSTRSSTNPHRRDDPASCLRRPMIGILPLSTRSPSFDSSAASTVTEPITAQRTIARDATSRLRDIAGTVGITERTAAQIVDDLEAAGLHHEDPRRTSQPLRGG